MNSKHISAGTRLRAALESEHPLQVVGTIHAYSALMAERVGFRALYVSGAGVANASHGWPDLALTSKTVGDLAGIVAGETAISTVGKTGVGLTYRGYDIQQLADSASFEEVAYLMLSGKLPNQAELARYQQQLVELRVLPADLKTILECLDGQAHPMDILRTACSALGVLEPESEGKYLIRGNHSSR